MEKKKKNQKGLSYKQDVKETIAQEPVIAFKKNLKAIPSAKNFTYNEFKKIADTTPFTQAEWASMLHVSERTLQRYSKNNSSFAPINAERALQIVHVLNEGKKTFGNVALFHHWITRNPVMLEGNLSFESLTTHDGIEKILTQLGRIQHGILA